MKPDEKFKEELKSCLVDLGKFAQVKTRDNQLAKELVQDTVVQALDNWTQYQTGTRMTAWLFTIMENLHVNNYRTAKTRKRRMEEYLLDAKAETDPTRVVHNGLDRVLLRQTGAVIEALPTEQKEALYLVGVEGYSYKEAADILQTEIGTIKSRVARARERLAQIFDEEFKGGPKRAVAR